MLARPLIIGLASLVGFFVVPFSAAAAGSDLIVTMQGPASAQRGQIVTYTVTIANNGSDSAPQARMTSSASSDFLFEPYYSDGRCNGPGGGISCTLGLLPSGIITRLTLAFTVRPLQTTNSCSALTANVTVSVSSGGGDPSSGNNSVTVRTTVPCPPRAACNDGIDNDRDGAVDYGNSRSGNGDFGCLGAGDRDEYYPQSVCQDGRDNDRDGRIDFPQDPGCSSRQDNDEFNPAPPAPPRPPVSPLPSPPPSPSVPIPSSPPPSFPSSSSWPPSYMPFARTPSSPFSPSPLAATFIPQGRMPWLALPIPRCYQDGSPGYVEDIMIDLRCGGSKWAGLPGFEGYGGNGGTGGRGGTDGRGGSGPFACNDGRDNDGDGRIDFPADPDCDGLRDVSEDATDGAGRVAVGGTGAGIGEGGVCTVAERTIIERTADRLEVMPGSIVRYTILMRNASPQHPLLNLVLRNPLVSGTVVLDPGSGVFNRTGMQWRIPGIAPGAVHRITYSVRVPRSFPGERFGGDVLLDGGSCLVSIRDQGSLRVMRRLPKTGVDLY